MKKHSKWVIILALLVLIILLPPGGATVSFPVPNPNGYDDFLRAAAAARRTLDEPEMRRIYNAGVYAASKEDLQNWILQGADAITLFHTGMARQCRVPVQTTPQYLAAHSQDAGSLKFLTHFLVAWATLAALEGRTNEALTANLEAYDFAHKIGEGGLATDFLGSLSCEALILRNLRSLSTALSPEQCSDAFKIIDQIERRQEQPGDVMRRTLDWQAASLDPALLAREKRQFWLRTGEDILKSRSLAPLDALPLRRLKKVLQRHEKEVEDLRHQLRLPRRVAGSTPNSDVAAGHRVEF